MTYPRYRYLLPGTTGERGVLLGAVSLILGLAAPGFWAVAFGMLAVAIALKASEGPAILLGREESAADHEMRLRDAARAGILGLSGGFLGAIAIGGL